MHGTFQDCAAVGYSSLRRRIGASDALYASLYDAEAGFVGQALTQAVSACNFTEIEASGQICENVYIPFDWHVGFVNTISYANRAPVPENFVVSRCHELLHGIAWNAVPVLHASPFNRAAPVMLSPRDWVALFEMSEADAYAKTAWLTTLAAQGCEGDYRHALRHSPVTIDEFEQLRHTYGDLAKTLEVAAGNGMSKQWGRDERDGSGMSFAQFYHWLALRDYTNQLDFLDRRGIRPTIVRADMGDLAAIGQSFGPNPFARNGYALTPLKPYEEAAVGALNARLGIYDESTLPHLATGLDWHGHTPQGFLACSRVPPAVSYVLPQAVASEPLTCMTAPAPALQVA